MGDITLPSSISLDCSLDEMPSQKGKHFKHKTQYTQEILLLLLMNLYARHSGKIKQGMLQSIKASESGELIAVAGSLSPLSHFGGCFCSLCLHNLFSIQPLL